MFHSEEKTVFLYFFLFVSRIPAEDEKKCVKLPTLIATFFTHLYISLSNLHLIFLPKAPILTHQYFKKKIPSLNQTCEM